MAPARLEVAGDVRFFMPPAGVSRLWVDLGDVTWISPIGVVGMLALARKAEQRGLTEVRITMPNASPVRDYLTKVGFLDAMEANGVALAEGAREFLNPEPLRPFLPATLITTEFEMEQAANRLDITLTAAGAPAHVRQAAWLVMTEITNNAWQHGSDCYVTAQTHTGEHSGTPGVDLAIADFGKGFLASLARYSPSTEVEAILIACQEGVSATGDPLRGLGLWYVIDAIDGFPEAHISIVSNDGWVERCHREFRKRSGPQCGGVFVTAHFPF